METFFTPLIERAAYAKACRAEATRLADIADVLTEFEFTQLALDVMIESSDLYDRAAQAVSTLGIDGMLVG